MRSTLTFRFGLVAAIAVILSLPAMAEIIGVGGDVTLIDPPASVQLGDLESNTEVFAFAELQGVDLPVDILVDASEPGIYANPYDLTPAAVSAGTVVHSYLLHLDPIGGDTVYLDGWVRFDRDILGVIVEDSSLDSTDDLLGWPGTAYPPAEGLELESDARDAFAIGGESRTLWMTLAANSALDHIRVITVPEPAGIVLVALGGLLPVRRRS